jgi:hypothetical protein
MIKLLSKNETAKAKALDQSREIAEGSKIAKRVDGLRELLAEESKTLDDFRTSTLAQISKETSEALTSRDSILSEVKELRKEKEQGLNEVSEARRELDAFKATLDDRELDLAEKAHHIEISEEWAAKNFLDAQRELVLSTNQREQADRLLQEAKDKENYADRVLKSAESIRERSANNEMAIQRELSARERNVAQRELLCAEQEEQNIKKEQELVTLKVQIDDKEGMLNRSIQRMKNGERP